MYKRNLGGGLGGNYHPQFLNYHPYYVCNYLWLISIYFINNIIKAIIEYVCDYLRNERGIKNVPIMIKLIEKLRQP